MRNFLLLLLLLSNIIIFGQSTTGLQLVADYPFATNANELTGNYQAATTRNVTYSSNSVYLNGQYSGSDYATAGYIKTDNIAELQSKFVINIDFYAEDNNNRPIFVLGYLYRWLSVEIYNGNFRIKVLETGNTFEAFDTSQAVSINTWHHLGISYDYSNRKLQAYFNNTLIIDQTLAADIVHDNEFLLLSENGGSGYAFKGYWKNLKIYGIRSASISGESNDLFSVYNDTQKGSIHIIFKNNEKSNLKIVDMTGKIIFEKKQIKDKKYQVSGLKSGIYIVMYQYENQRYLKKIFVE